MGSQLLDKLMKEEYERTFQLDDDDEPPIIHFFKEEEEDDKTYLSEFIVREDEMINELQEDTHLYITKTSPCKEELDIDYDDKSSILMHFKKEEKEDEMDYNAYNKSTLGENEFCTNPQNFSHSLEHFKEEEKEEEADEIDYNVYNESTPSENEFCTIPQNFSHSLLEHFKEEEKEKEEEEEEADEIDYNVCNESTPSENEFCAIPQNFSHSLLEHFKEEEEDDDEMNYNVCNESTLSENGLCIHPQNSRPSLLELFKDEVDDDCDMYELFTADTTEYEEIFDIPLEEDIMSDISESIKKRAESNLHSSFTESTACFRAGSTKDYKDYKLPFFDEDFATNFLIKKNLLANYKNNQCHKCGGGVKYYTRVDRGKKRKVLRCKKKGCQTTQSLRKNNSFWACIDKNGRSISKLSISAQLELVYYWCQNFSAHAIMSITGKSNHTVYNWMNLCQEIPLRMFKNRSLFGGPQTIIHIYYRSVTQLKLNNGGHLDNPPKSSPWVLVLCSNNEERYFLLETNDTNALCKIIKQEVAAGSIIHSGRWMEHNKLFKYGYNHHIVDLDEDFNHSVVNAHIQRIENVWKPLVLFYKCRRSITPTIFSNFLIETWWRGLNKSDPFNYFLRDLGKVF